MLGRFICGVILLALLIGCGGKSLTFIAEVSQPTKGKALVQVVGQPSGAWVTWTPSQPAQVRWKEAVGGAWQQTLARNGKGIEVPCKGPIQIEVVGDDWVVNTFGRPSVGVASFAEYKNIEPRLNIFSDFQSADSWLKSQNIDARSIRRRGIPEPWNEAIPDGWFMLPDGRFLVLIRQAQSQFAEPIGEIDQARVRAELLTLLWPDGIPATTVSVIKSGLEIVLSNGLKSRVAIYRPSTPGRKVAIYQEGHGGAATEIGGETIDALTKQGWTVLAMDMPLIGANSVDRRPGLQSHYDLEQFGGPAVLLEPVHAVVNWIYANLDPETLALVGRSGGGWTAYTYGALDERIDLVANIAGGSPLSVRLAAGPLELGDYEQFWPELYTVAPHEVLMAMAGTRGSFHAYSGQDRCCFQMRGDEPWIQWLNKHGRILGKTIETYAEPSSTTHGLTSAGINRMVSFLEAHSD